MVKVILVIVSYFAVFFLGFCLAALASSVRAATLEAEIKRLQGLFDGYQAGTGKPKPNIVGLSGKARGSGRLKQNH